MQVGIAAEEMPDIKHGQAVGTPRLPRYLTGIVNLLNNGRDEAARLILQAAMAASHHVLIAAARNARCVVAEVR